MVVVPADDVVLVGIGLFGNTIIEDNHSIILRDLPHVRLDDLLQLGRREAFFRQQPLNLVMANAASQQPGQTRSRCLSECANEIIAINVEQFFVVHPVNLSHLLYMVSF